MLTFRFADKTDVDLYFRWVNDPEVRNNSYNTEPIEYDAHVKWFYSKIASPDCALYIFLAENGVAAGQVRIEQGKTETVTGISVDKDFRGRSLGTQMLKMACEDFKKRRPGIVIHAYIKEENIPSLATFRKAGFGNEQKVILNDRKSIKFSLH